MHAAGVHHRLRNALLAVLAVVLLGVAFVGISYLTRDTPQEASVDDALDAFRSETTPPSTGSFTQPAPGVYEAAGFGEESLSVPPLSQSDGATMPITVRLLEEGCWRWRLDYSSAHWHEYEFCPEGTGLILTSQRQSQTWDLGVDSITNLSDTTCDPPAAILVAGSEPGDSVEHTCTVVNTAAEGGSQTVGPSTMVGRETLTIGGVEVRTIHQRRSSTMSGTQTGRIDEEWWLEEETGLPVRVERDYDLTTESTIGDIRYQEQGEWQLSSMTPRT